MRIFPIIATPIILLPLMLLLVKPSSMLTLDDIDESDEDFNSPKVPIGRPSKDICPKLNLLNGRVRIRSRGRVVKFICRPGFQMLGKRYSTCVRGRWNTEIPICIARGCVTVDPPAYGRVFETYRGGLLTFECNPGYIIEGSSTLFCNGLSWNASTPKCRAVEKPKLTCDFEREDLCGWTHDPFHDFDWKRHNFGTPSGHVGTGPSHDHTFGDGKDGYYMYMEASSPRKENDTARLYSPVYPNTVSEGACFRFWYHMYGATTGFLRVFVKPASFNLQDLTPQFQAAGDHGNRWIEGAIPITKFSESFQIVIEGIRGTSYVSDSAIDDVAITFNDDCSTLSTPVTIPDVSTAVTKSASDFDGPEEGQSTLNTSSTTYQTEHNGTISLSSQPLPTWVSSSGTDAPLTASQSTWKMVPTTTTVTTTLASSTTTQKATTKLPIISVASTTAKPIITTMKPTPTTTPPVTTKTTTITTTRATTTTTQPNTITTTRATTTTPKPTTTATTRATTTTKPTTIKPTRATTTTKPTTPKPLVTTKPPTKSTTTTLKPITTKATITSTPKLPTTTFTTSTTKSHVSMTTPVEPLTSLKTTTRTETPKTGNTGRQTASIQQTTQDMPKTMLSQQTTSTTSDAKTSQTSGSLPSKMTTMNVIVTRSTFPLEEEETSSAATRKYVTKMRPPWLYWTTTKRIAIPKDNSKPESQQHTDLKTSAVSTTTGLSIGAVCIVMAASAIVVFVLRRRRQKQSYLSDDSDVRYLKDDEVRVEFLDSNGKITYDDGL